MRQRPSSQTGQRQRCQELAGKLVPKAASSAGRPPLLIYRLTHLAPLFIPEPCPSLPGLLTLQILLRFQSHGEHVLGMHTAEGWGDRDRMAWGFCAVCVLGGTLVLWRGAPVQATLALAVLR